MPYISAIASPFASLKLRPVENAHLKEGELIKVPKGQKLAVTFPYSDSDKPLQAVRLVGAASNLGLKAGDVLYAFTKEWHVNDAPWSLVKPKSKSSNPVSALSKWLGLGKKEYKPVMQRGDYHLVVVDDESLPTSTMECFDHNGDRLWTRKCLARGQVADYGLYSGDTPVGLYYLGELWEAASDDVATCKPYGIHCFDMVSVVDGEDAVGRAGICLHGGGSALGYPGCIEEYQELVPTFGCVRMHTIDLRETIYPIWKECDRNGKKVWMSVYQLT
ncbi:MAG: hypothetical protein ACRC62_15770 [Microcoleus sp.]